MNLSLSRVWADNKQFNHLQPKKEMNEFTPLPVFGINRNRRQSFGTINQEKALKDEMEVIGKGLRDFSFLQMRRTNDEWGEGCLKRGVVIRYDPIDKDNNIFNSGDKEVWQ